MSKLIMEGYIGSPKPQIKKVSFPARGRMEILLTDGRAVTVPVSKFPSIRKLNEEQRKKWQVIGGDFFTFRDCDEVYHIEQILGKEEDYSYTPAVPEKV